MRRVALLLLLSCGVAGVAVAAADVKPIAVSPGRAEAFSGVAAACPTFSWAASKAAETYSVAVFEVGQRAAERAAEEGLVEGASRLALRAEIPGAALSWTPSSDRCLAPGRYSWSVRSTARHGAESWSEPLLFEVRSAAFLGLSKEELQASDLAGLSNEELGKAIRRLLGNRSPVVAGTPERVRRTASASVDMGSVSEAVVPARGGEAPARENRDVRGGDLNAPVPAGVFTDAKAAIWGEAGTGQQAGVIGVGGTAGIIASHATDAGPDLILDNGSAPNSAAAFLSEDGLQKNKDSKVEFAFRNMYTGKVDVSADGDLAAGNHLVSHTGTYDARSIPFYVGLGGAGFGTTTATIWTGDDFDLVVKCTVAQLAPFYTVQVTLRHAEDGWFTNTSGITAPFSATDEVTVLKMESSGTNVTNDIDDFFAIAPNGDYVAIDGETVALGSKVFGHSCIAAGTVRAFHAPANVVPMTP